MIIKVLWLQFAVIFTTCTLCMVNDYIMTVILCALFDHIATID